MKKSALTPVESKQRGQLSSMAIRERLRAATPQAIERLIELMHSKNPSVALGAVKVCLDKVVPSMTENMLVGKDGEDLRNLINVVIQPKSVAE
ncbi:MAG: hypothetical protein M3P98_04430 [bacterium]|nr:hypothetical protein [bacterium]